jgi:hypothetical protein
VACHYIAEPVRRVVLVSMAGGCFYNQASTVDLDTANLDTAHWFLTIAIAGAVFLYLSVRVWKDDEDLSLKVVLRTSPLLVLALSYICAFNFPNTCLSPAAFGHWVVCAVVFVNMQRVLFRKLEVPYKRGLLISAITIVQFVAISATAYNRDVAASALPFAGAVSLVLLYLGGLLHRETEYGGETTNVETLWFTFVAQAAFVAVYAVGFRGFGWLPPVGLVWSCGCIEAGTLMWIGLQKREHY